MKFKFLFLLLIYQIGYSQLWVNSLDDAKKLAKTSNRFILMDFNAVWCKPCKKMETDFWHNSKYKSTLDKFIIVPIDIDIEENIARSYSVKSIPNVKLVDANGEVIYETSGFENAESFNKLFSGFPESSEDLYEKLNFKKEKFPTDEELLNLATSYQILLQKSKNIAKDRFFELSNSFFNKCIKNTSDNNFKELAELGKFLNLTFVNSGDKVIRKLDISKFSEENKSFSHYILAGAYYLEKNREEAEKHIFEIKKINNEQWVYAAEILKEKYK